MTKDKLTGLVTEITGASKDDTTTKCIVSTFWSLKEFADFDSSPLAGAEGERGGEQISPPPPPPSSIPENQRRPAVGENSDDVNFAVSYTINLNLPETTNPDVFNAIFRALKENLLTRR